MSFFWLFWFAWLGATLIARSYYRSNREKRPLIVSDKRFLQRFFLRPLFLLGEWDERTRQNRRFWGEGTTSIMPRQLSNNLVLVQKKEEIVVPPGAKLVIHNSGIARRCEVCHQTDRFDAGTGLCQRCNHRTA